MYPVSYTHLDVYKRQVRITSVFYNFCLMNKKITLTIKTSKYWKLRYRKIRESGIEVKTGVRNYYPMKGKTFP